MLFDYVRVCFAVVGVVVVVVDVDVAVVVAVDDDVVVVDVNGVVVVLLLLVLLLVCDSAVGLASNVGMSTVGTGVLAILGALATGPSLHS